MMPTHMTLEMPEDLQAILNDFGKADTEARELVDGLSNAQLNWRPKITAWSIAQCLDHLAITNRIYMEALRNAVRNAKGTSIQHGSSIRPGWLERYFVKSMDAPPNRKFKAVKKVIPSTHKGKEEILAALFSSHEEIRSLISECSGMDLNRIRFRNPLIGIFRFTVGAGLLIMAAHDRRHLWQARQVRNLIVSQGIN